MQEQFNWVAAHRLRHPDRFIVYIDETSLNLWSCLKKSTWTDNRNVTMPLQPTAGKSKTIIGAIGAFLYNKPYRFCFIFDIIDKTNGETVKGFLQLLLNQLPVHTGQITLYLDQSSVHQCNKIKDFGDEYGLELILTPRYSCALNPIEHVWALIKRRWATRMAATSHNVKDENMKANIAAVCDEVGRSLTKEIMHASDKYHERVLKKQLV